MARGAILRRERNDTAHGSAAHVSDGDWTGNMSGSDQDRTDPAVIDVGVLHDIRDLMEDDFPDLVRRFLADAADLLTRMDQAAAQGDADLMHRASHTLKSSAAALGAVGLSNCAKHLEALGRAGALASTRTGARSSADTELAEAHAQYSRVKAALERSLSEGSADRPQPDR
jgi:HPt (histidine-containing phosphotransfer) domain-containing protein